MVKNFKQIWKKIIDSEWFCETVKARKKKVSYLVADLNRGGHEIGLPLDIIYQQ